jgi:hypothetical protein
MYSKQEHPYLEKAILNIALTLLFIFGPTFADKNTYMLFSVNGTDFSPPPYIYNLLSLIVLH